MLFQNQSDLNDCSFPRKGHRSLEQFNSFVSRTSLSREEIIGLGEECEDMLEKNYGERVSLDRLDSGSFLNICKHTSCKLERGASPPSVLKMT